MPDRLAVNPRVAQTRLSGADNAYGRPFPWLASVAAAFALVQLVLVVPGSGLGWDETVYVSQVSRDVPAAFFSAPRARGISYLVAPVAALTSSTAALHVYLALCSAFGLFVALWVWRRLLPPAVLAGAGAMFAGLWITLYYGPMAMPNLWCALGSLAAVGCFLRAVRDTTDGKALMRPRCRCGSGRPHAALGRLLPGPASGRGSRGGPGLAARGRARRARGRPSPRLGTMDHRSPTALRRRGRPVAPRQRDSGRPGPTSRRRRSDSSPGRADPVPPVRGALEAPDHRGVVVRAAAVHGGRHHRQPARAAPPPSSRPWSRRPWRRPTCS